MGVLIYPIRSWPLALVVLVGAAAYGAALVGLRALTTEEWAILRAGLRPR
jgi:hypothetical protein